jgi:hypothetical protein
VARASSDAAGRYELFAAAGSYRLTASRRTADPQPRARPVILATAAVAVGQRVNVDLVVPDPPAANVAGTVLEPDGAPSPGATVRVTSMATSQRTITRTDASDGTFSISLPAEGDAVISARNGGRLGSATVAVPSTALVVQLQPAAAIQGRLLGDPPPETFELTSSTVGAMPWGGAPSRLQFLGSTFALPDLAPGDVAVHVRSDDGRVGDARASLSPGEARSIEIALSPAAIVAGRVVDARTAQPITRVWVTIDGISRGVGADGRFLRAVTAGDHQLSLAAAGYGTVARTITARAAVTNDLGDVQLVPSAR